MLTKIKKSMLIALSLLFLSLSFSPALAVAQSRKGKGNGNNSSSNAAESADINNKLCSGAANLKFNENTNCDDAAITDSDSSVNDLIGKIINIFSVVVGIIAVIMIVYGGFRYITSGGDSAKVTSARNTILYALIGLVIVAIAQFIVKFVLSKATNAT